MGPAPVLLVIDLQEGLVAPPEDEPRSTPNLTSNVEKILGHWRSHRWPVVHVHHDDPDPSNPINKFTHPDKFVAHACSAPRDDELLLHKHTGSAFVDPRLEIGQRLDRLGGKKGGVVIIGMDGAQCVNDNTRSANDLGFAVTVVADACATFGMDDYRDPRKKIGAEDTHTAAMSMLGNGFAKVVMTEEVLKMYDGV